MLSEKAKQKNLKCMISIKIIENTSLVIITKNTPVVVWRQHGRNRREGFPRDIGKLKVMEIFTILIMETFSWVFMHVKGLSNCTC